LKRNPNNNNNTINNNNNNNSPTSSAGSSSNVQTFELSTPNRSGTSSPSLESELTPELLGEIDFNTGLDGFLLAALKNPKDRLFLLKLDREMERFIKDKKYIIFCFISEYCIHFVINLLCFYN